MRIEFPTDFFWGTSTSAPQTETAFDHQWKGFIARDEFVLNRTTDHELRREEDLQYIQQFGTVYRCGVDWSRLQRSAFAEFDQQTVSEYRHFFQQLQEGGTKVLLVLHHFAHPNWFEQKGGWLQEDKSPLLWTLPSSASSILAILYSTGIPSTNPTLTPCALIFWDCFRPNGAATPKPIGCCAIWLWHMILFMISLK